MQAHSVVRREAREPKPKVGNGKESLRRYVELTEEIRELEAERKELRESVEASLEALGGKAKIGDNTVSLTERVQESVSYDAKALYELCASNPDLFWACCAIDHRTVKGLEDSGLLNSRDLNKLRKVEQTISKVVTVR